MANKSSNTKNVDDDLSSRLACLMLDTCRRSSTNLMNFSTTESENPQKLEDSLATSPNSTQIARDDSTSLPSKLLDSLEESSKSFPDKTIINHEITNPEEQKSLKNVPSPAAKEHDETESLSTAQDFHKLWNQDQESMYKRLSACYQANPENFNEKLKTILEESNLNITDVKDTSGVSLDKLNGEFLKICKFIGDETMPEWAPSFSEDAEKTRLGSPKHVKLEQLLRGMVTSSPLRKIGEFLKEQQVNDTNTFEQLEQYCDENYERPKSSLSSVTSSTVLDSSTKSLYEKCERQMESLEKDVSLVQCLNRGRSSEDEYYTPEDSSSKSPIYSADDLALEEEIRIRQKRRLEMAQLMKEIDGQAGAEGHVLGEDNKEGNVSTRSTDLDYSNVTVRNSQRSSNFSAQKVKEASKKSHIPTSKSAIPQYTSKFSSRKKPNPPNQKPIPKSDTKLKTPSTLSTPRFIRPMPSSSLKKTSEKTQVSQKNLPLGQKPQTPFKVNRKLFPAPTSKKIPEPVKIVETPTKIKLTRARRSKSMDFNVQHNLRVEKQTQMMRIKSESRLVVPRTGQTPISASLMDTKTKIQNSGVGKKASYFASPGGKFDPSARKKPISYFKDPANLTSEKKLLGPDGRLTPRRMNDKFQNIVSPVGIYVRYKDKNLITNVKAGNDEWMCTPKDGSESAATLPFKLASPMTPSITATHEKDDCGIPQVEYNLPKNVHVIKESPKIFPCRGVLEAIENKVVQRHQGRVRTPGKSQNPEQLPESSGESLDMSLLIEKPANHL